MKKILLGIIIGLIIAPKKGSELLEDVKEGVVNTYNSIKEMDADDFKAKVNDVKESIQDFDFQDAKDKVVKKANEVKTKVDTFVASDKVQKTVDTVKEKTDQIVSKASEVTQQVADKAMQFAGHEQQNDTLAEELEAELAKEIE